MVLRARQSRGGEVVLQAEPVEPRLLAGPGAGDVREAGVAALEEGIGRMRFSLGVDDDLTEFVRTFRGDPTLGPALGNQLAQRPQRRAVAWEALLWAITEQLIEYRRAAGIQRRMIRRFGIRLAEGPAAGLVAVPSPERIAAAAPAELESCGLAGRRSVATIKVAREVASGRVDPEDAAGDPRLLAIPEIGPWTVACLALRGRGEADALLAGDLAQVKLVGYLQGLGRLAEIEEVESFYERYSPWRGFAGEYLARTYGKAISGPGNRARIATRAA